MSDTHQRVMNMIARGRLSAVDDSNGMQFVQVSLLRDEAKADVERFQQYGFSSVPPPGSEAVCLFIGGGRDHGIVMSIDNRKSRMRGQAAGEVGMYSDEGDYIVLKRGNTVEVGTDRLVIHADVEVEIEVPLLVIRAPRIEIEGDVFINGNLVTTGTGGGGLHMTGNITVDGNITATGAINAPHGSVGGGRDA